MQLFCLLRVQWDWFLNYLNRSFFMSFVMSMTMIILFFFFLTFLTFLYNVMLVRDEENFVWKSDKSFEVIILSFFLCRSIIKCEQLFFESKHFVFFSLMRRRSSFVIIRVMMYACARSDFFALSEFSLISVENRDFSTFRKSFFYESWTSC
jgi:hypothetical protein